MPPAKMNIDNTGAIDLASNPVHHERTKHIDIRHHFIREQVTEFKTLKLKYVESKLNDADMLTKTTIPVREFQQCRSRVLGQ
jgi:hypothetical protein